VAALVNDFAQVDIDAAIIATVADDVVQLSNGCVCCTINGDLLAATQRVLELTPAVDRIFVETTGLADPLAVGLTYLQTELRQRTFLDAILALVDCQNTALDLSKADVAAAQIAHCDIVVLNKIDSVPEEAIAAIENRIRVIKPKARILRTVRGQVPLAAVLGHSSQAHLLTSNREDIPAKDTGRGFKAYSYRFDEPLSASRFQAWIDRGLPSGIYRAKGLIRFDKNPQAYAFHLCGTRPSFDAFPGLLEGNRLVFIGTGIDEDTLARRLWACIDYPASPGL
jgi:G3E family GTPase